MLNQWVGLVFACVLFSACGDDDGAAPTDAGPREDTGPGRDGGGDPDAGPDLTPTSTMIRAAEGGLAPSADRRFAIYIPPGSLAEDTEISIRLLAAAEVPADLVDLDPISGVYDVQPHGLEFAEASPAQAMFFFPTTPDGLVSGDSYAVVCGAARSPEGVIEPWPTCEAIYDPMGWFGVAGTMRHFSYQFANVGIAAYRDRADVIMSTDVYFPDEASHAIDAPFNSHTRVRLDPAPTPPPPGFGSIVFDGLGVTWFHRTTSAAQILGGTPRRFETVGGDLYGFFLGALGDIHETYGAETGDRITAFPADYTVTPPCQWSCRRAGPGSIGELIRVAYRVISEGLPLGITHEASVRVGAQVTCVEGTTGVERRDAILLVVNRRLVRVGALYESTEMPGLVANVIHAHDDTLAGFTDLGSDTSIFEGVTTFRSNAGPPVITLEAVDPPGTVVQTGTATFDGTRYAISGFTTGAGVFETPGSFLRVTGTPPGAGAPVVEMVTPESRRSDAGLLEEIFGTNAGLATTVSFPDGTWDQLYVYVTAVGGATGESGIIRIVPRESIPIDGTTGRRTTPLVPMAAIDALSARGLFADQIYVGLIDETSSTMLFPGLRPIPVQAGWTFQVAATDLGAPRPPPSYARRDCSELPATLEEIDGTTAGVLCVDDADAFCFVSTDPREDMPASRLQCIGADRAGEYFATGRICAEPGWEMAYSSHGIAAPCDAPTGTGERHAILERVADGRRYEVRITPGSGSFTATAMAPFSGTLPAYGTRTDCAAAPRSFPAGATAGPHARLCVEGAGARCYVLGDTFATPEDDSCEAGGVALELYYDGGIYAYAGSGWTVESTSHGTFDPGGVYSYPTDTDVSVVVANTGRTKVFRIVFRLSAAGAYTVQSVTRI